MSLTKTWNALVVKNKSDMFSDMNINFRNSLDRYQVKSAFAINEVTSTIYTSIIYLYLLVCFFAVLILDANLL